jgi:hypothetical protein
LIERGLQLLIHNGSSWSSYMGSPIEPQLPVLTLAIELAIQCMVTNSSTNLRTGGLEIFWICRFWFDSILSYQSCGTSSVSRQWACLVTLFWTLIVWKSQFFENPLSGKSIVWKIEVFGNPNYFHRILYLSCKMTRMPLRLVITHFHHFFLSNTIVAILI